MAVVRDVGLGLGEQWLWLGMWARIRWAMAVVRDVGLGLGEWLWLGMWARIR